ncbi:MAG: hypothetical protein IVW57_00125 [Ktedonobacterales bacterium]|nr:hypothetical protein [Ktedonobacterales bacterium]
MAITFVQGGKGGNSATSLTVTLPAATTAGNLLVAVLESDATATETFTLPSGWSLAKSVGNTNSGTTLAIAYAANSAGGATTFTFQRASNTFTFTVFVAEYSGLATASVLDQVNGTFGNGTSASALSITTTQASELLIMAGVWDGTATLAAGASMTLRDQQQNGATSGWEDRILTATGTYSPTMTSTLSANNIGVQASFAAASGSGGLSWNGSDRQSNSDPTAAATLTSTFADTQTAHDALGPVAYVPVLPADTQASTDGGAAATITLTPSFVDRQSNADTRADTLVWIPPAPADSQANTDGWTAVLGALSWSASDSQQQRDSAAYTLTPAVTADAQINSDGSASDTLVWTVTAADSQQHADAWTATLNGNLVWNATGDAQSTSDAWVSSVLTWTPLADVEANSDTGRAVYSWPSTPDTAVNTDTQAAALTWLPIGDGVTPAEALLCALVWAPPGDGNTPTDTLHGTLAWVVSPADVETNTDTLSATLIAGITTPTISTLLRVRDGTATLHTRDGTGRLRVRDGNGRDLAVHQEP